MAQALRGLRVIDLSNRLSGAYAARLFGDFGANVILAEPADGHALRHEAPFVDDEAGPENSLLHGYANWNNRSTVVTDVAELTELVSSADCVVTTDHPPWSIASITPLHASVKCHSRVDRPSCLRARKVCEEVCARGVLSYQRAG